MRVVAEIKDVKNTGEPTLEGKLMFVNSISDQDSCCQSLIFMQCENSPAMTRINHDKY